jgi:phosphatidate cytidylyltransferase
MAAGDERERGFDDLFEDLDRFFDPDGEHSEQNVPDPEGTSPRPQTSRPRAEATAPSGGSGGGGDPPEGERHLPVRGNDPMEGTGQAGARGGGTGDPEEADPGDTDSADPEAPDAPDADTGDTGEHPPIQSWQSTGPEEPPSRREPDQDQAAPSRGSGVRRPAGGGAWHEPSEGTGEDWGRLRDVLGEEDEESEELEFLTAEPPPSPEESLFGMGGADYGERSGDLEAAGTPYADEPAAISIEDLKKPPAEYRDLPGPLDEGPEEAVRGEGPGESAGAEEAGFAEPPAGQDEEPYPGWTEPAITEIGDTADQLMEEFGPAPGGVEDDLLADLHEPAPAPSEPAVPAAPARRTIRITEPESMTGPSWEEPASMPLRAEQPRPGLGGRDLPLAIITGMILAVAALITLWLAKSAFAVVATVAVLLAQTELYTAFQRRGYQPATALGVILGALTMCAAYFKGEQAALAILPLSVVMITLWYMAAPPKGRENAVVNIGLTLLGLVYVPFLASYILMILTLPFSGRALVLTVLALTFLYDVAAFFVGSYWGRRALAPSISPKKTWEGLIAATLIILAVSIAFVSNHPLNWRQALGLGAILTVAAPLGDLAESVLKRDLGVKDMGSLLPGHGGLLDRIDSVLFVAPAAFYFLRLIF